MVNLPICACMLHLCFGPPVTSLEVKTCSTEWEAEGKPKKDTGKARISS